MIQFSLENFEDYLFVLYTLLLCAVFAIVFTAQGLGFLGLYVPLLVLPLTLIVFVVAWFFYVWLFKYWQPRPMIDTPDDIWYSRITFPPRERLVLVCLAIFLGVVFAYRMVIFPQSSLGNLIPSDLMGYHAIKAVELFRTGSMWDLSILYGDYPNGYESLIAFFLIFTGRMESVGIVHLLIGLLFGLTLYFLIRFYTALPPLWVALASSACLFLPFVYSQVLAVGKNDLLLVTMILGAVLHADLFMGRESSFHPLGLAYCTMVAMATKANGVFVLVYLWGIVGVLFIWLFWHERELRKFCMGIATVFVGLLLPSVFWVLRNLLIMKRPFSPEVASFGSTSLLANISNPLVYQSGNESTLLFGAVLISIVIGGVYVWRTRAYLVGGLLLVMWLGFIATPLSAFHTPVSVTLKIEWRYATHLWLLLVILAITIMQPVLARLYRYSYENQLVGRVLTIGFISIGGAIVSVLGVDDLLGRTSANDYKFYEESPQATGVDGYHSVYDFVRQNIRNSKIWYDIAEHYYLYGEGFSNQPNAGYKYPLGMPEVVAYFVPNYAVISTTKGLQDEVLRLGQAYEWREIYQDDAFTVLERIP